MPNDEEVRQGLRLRKAYGGSASHISRAILSALVENESYDSFFFVNLNAATLEHIMPQRLSRQWKDVLGGEYHKIHHEPLHRLQNLTLHDCLY